MASASPFLEALGVERLQRLRRERARKAVGTEAWSVVWTRIRHEHRAGRGLKGKGLAAFLSAVPRAGRRTDGRKAPECSLFPGYLFYYELKNPGLQPLVPQTPGVARILGESCHKLVLVPPGGSLRQLRTSGVVLAAVPCVYLGERVRDTTTVPRRAELS